MAQQQHSDNTSSSSSQHHPHGKEVSQTKHIHEHRSALVKLVKQFGNKHKLQFFPRDHIDSDESNLSLPSPLVVILGWYGSKFRFVSKYAEIYNAWGYDVLAYIPDSWELFAKYYSEQGVKTILNMIEKDQKETETGFMIHSFSNNGGIFVSRTMEILSSSGNEYSFVKKQYRGLIADSFPGVNTEDLGALAVLSGYSYDKKAQKIIPDKSNIGIIGTIMRLIIYYLFYLYYFVFTGLFKTYFETYLAGLRKTTSVFGNQTPILVIYADQDFIVPAKQVHRFWSSFNDAKNLKLSCFEGNIDHIKIFIAEPEKYRSELEAFTSTNVPHSKK
ncbi:hypothetical protein C9374_011963 [Naegleria lovaniensis]|uniref:Uncharacterized protein n=1 Tax=Naegleria lovaniensis TaxID=51637 RepID=A0AA88GDX1_NAELO|nr:uncharacterized protein C9374_011963 [Naegleria lovaniensis]KAG2373674.1 hypothetical protein C9374_011963 [Naegleria lovaniensis]